MKKTDELKNVSISYDNKNGSIRVSSKDPRIKGQPFFLEVPSGSSTYETLFNLINDEDTSDDPYPKKFALTQEAIQEFYETHTREEILIGLDSEYNYASMNTSKHHHTLIAGTIGGGKSVLQRNIYTTILAKDYGNIYAFDLKKKELPGSIHIYNSRIARTPEDALTLIRDATIILENRARTREQPKQWKPLYILIDEYAEIKNKNIGEEFESWLTGILYQGGEYGIHVILGTQKASTEMLHEISQYFTRQIVAGRADRQTYETVFGKPTEYRAGLFYDPSKNTYFSEPDPSVKNAPPGRMIIQENGVQELIMMGFITEHESDRLISEKHKSTDVDENVEQSIFGNEILGITEIGELAKYETLNH